MIDNRITPQAMCAACGHIFPTDKSATEEVRRIGKSQKQ